MTIHPDNCELRQDFPHDAHKISQNMMTLLADMTKGRHVNPSSRRRYTSSGSSNPSIHYCGSSTYSFLWWCATKSPPFFSCRYYYVINVFRHKAALPFTAPSLPHVPVKQTERNVHFIRWLKMGRFDMMISPEHVRDEPKNGDVGITKWISVRRPCHTWPIQSEIGSQRVKPARWQQLARAYE